MGEVMENNSKCVVIYLKPSNGRSYSDACNVLVSNLDNHLLKEHLAKANDNDLDTILECPVYPDSVMVISDSSKLLQAHKKISEYKISHERKIGRRIVSRIQQMVKDSVR